MWTIIIGLFLGLIASIVIVFKTEGKYADFSDYFFHGFIGLIISGVISSVIAFSLPVKLQAEVCEVEIVTLQDNSQTTGRFFLGSGFINGTMKYVFYYKYKESYIMHMVDYSSAEIIITDKTPYLKQISYMRTKDFINNFSFDFEYPETEFIFYVPKGTISSNYSLDAL